MLTLFDEKVLEVLEPLAPMRKRQVRKNQSSWVLAESRSLMIIRDEKWEEARRSQEPEHWAQYRLLKKEYSRDQKGQGQVFLKSI